MRRIAISNFSTGYKDVINILYTYFNNVQNISEIEDKIVAAFSTVKEIVDYSSYENGYRILLKSGKEENEKLLKAKVYNALFEQLGKNIKIFVNVASEKYFPVAVYLEADDNAQTILNSVIGYDTVFSYDLSNIGGTQVFKFYVRADDFDNAVKTIVYYLDMVNKPTENIMKEDTIKLPYDKLKEKGLLYRKPVDFYTETEIFKTVQPYFNSIVKAYKNNDFAAVSMGKITLEKEIDILERQYNIDIFKSYTGYSKDDYYKSLEETYATPKEDREEDFTPIQNLVDDDKYLIHQLYTQGSNFYGFDILSERWYTLNKKEDGGFTIGEEVTQKDTLDILKDLYYENTVDITDSNK